MALATMSRDLIEHGLGWRYTPSRIAALLAEPETCTVVACDQSGIGGFAVMQFGDDHAHLSLLCVQPALQRRAVGRRMIDWLVGSARVAGMSAIRLELRADNTGALAFYRAQGFAENGLVPGYYDGRIAARRMLLRLQATGL